jgi:hypothetical protein
MYGGVKLTGDNKKVKKTVLHDEDTECLTKYTSIPDTG